MRWTDEDAVLDLSIHSGTATLRNTTIDGKKIHVHRGDACIKAIDKGVWVLAKLDVEGYELRVLKGFQSLIARPRTGFIVEITDQWLKDMGGSANELFSLMHAQGYKAYLPKSTILSKFEFSLLRGPLDGRHQYDVVFLRPEDAWLTR